MEEARGGQHPGQNRQREGAEEHCHSGPKDQREDYERAAHHQRRAAAAGTEGAVCCEPAGAMADRHPRDCAGEEIYAAERHRQSAWLDALGGRPEVNLRCVSSS